ncbi:MAG: hypothetical protein ABIP51_12400 [Bacteroidia bacterium]
MTEKYKHYSTVGDLKKFIELNKLPDDAKILVQRIEDFYFENNNWETINKEESKYIVAWCPVKYKDDENLYLDCHY